jgi:hypothetical protein
MFIPGTQGLGIWITGSQVVLRAARFRLRILVRRKGVCGPGSRHVVHLRGFGHQ